MYDSWLDVCVVYVWNGPVWSTKSAQYILGKILTVLLCSLSPYGSRGFYQLTAIMVDNRLKKL